MELTCPTCPKCGRTVLSGTVSGNRATFFCYGCQTLLSTDLTQVEIVTLSANTALTDLFEAKLAEHCPDLVILRSKKVGKEMKVVPDRRFLWDYVFAGKVAVEVDGLVHRTRSSFFSDVQKHNIALMDGWQWLRVNRALLSDEKKCRQFFEQLQTLVERRQS